MPKIYLYFLVFSFSLVGCQKKEVSEEAITAEEEQVQILRKEVMHLHNQTMEKIEPLIGLKSRLKEKGTALRDNPDKVDEVIVVEMLVQSLDKAQTSMREWMQRYNAHKINDDHVKELEFLELEKKNILAVEAQMKTAMDAAEGALAAE